MNKSINIVLIATLLGCSTNPASNDRSQKEEVNSNWDQDVEQSNTEQSKPEIQPELNKTIVLGDFNGKIAKNLDVKFHLENNKGNVSGFYYYVKNGEDIQLVGTVVNQKLELYELTYTNDTLARIEATITDSMITGKWINTKTKAKHNLQLRKARKEVLPLPNNITGTYKEENCNLTLIISKAKGDYFYKYISDERTLKGKVSFVRGEDIYLTLANIEYAEDYFDLSLPEEDEKSAEYEKLKKIGKRQMGVDCFLDKNEIIIQNAGNAMNYYVKLYDCDEKYIHLVKQ